MKSGIGRKLDPTRRSKTVEDFEVSLRHKIIGQQEALETVVDVFQTFKAGLNPPRRPVSSLLFLGPTGTGKTHVVEAWAEILFGEPDRLIKVDCAEFQHSQEIARLIGSPPGYLGHRETHPVFTQEAINKWHTEDNRITLVLFDEIEKASDALWQLLLGVLDKGTLTLGDNQQVDMTSCVIIMTSNIGAAEMSDMASGGIGFSTRSAQLDTDFHSKIQRTAVDAARKKFSPEFMNRIDKSIVFNNLRFGHLEQILDLELATVQKRILQTTGSKFMFECSAEVKTHLLKEGTDLRYGARELKRCIERYLVKPLSNIISTSQIQNGDFIRVSCETEAPYIFTVESENSIVPMLLAQLHELGVTTVAHIEAPVEESPAIKEARRKLAQSEARLSEAKKRKEKEETAE